MARWITLGFLLLAAAVWVWAAGGDESSKGGNPVLVELFTSEGCSSCPPADRLLQELDRKQPVSGANLIVLSEHVDYWNQLGWSDPYSSHFFSQRQSSYSDHFGLNSVYTPQMVVDGSTEFVGSDSQQADRACEKAVSDRKVAVRITGVSLDSGNIRAHVETGELNSASSADVVVAVALNHAESQVERGENSGRRLSHVAVVRSLATVGSIEKGKSFARDLSLKIPTGTDPSNLRLIAFVQEPGPGKVLGAASERVK
jgi:hypothetical protein